MSDPLRVGLLQAGYVHPQVAAAHADYPRLFADLLGPLGVELTVFDVPRDGVPPDSSGQDGWIVSGSASSAYDDEPWIAPLEGFVRDLMDRTAPLVGICFGHQLLAQAMGGRVERAEVGWGVGVHDYHLVGSAPAWMSAPVPDPVRVVASHQDQVTVLPDGAVVYLRNEFCPNAGYTLGDNAMTMQPHPEFTAALSQDLLDVRRDRIGAARVGEAEVTLTGSVHQAEVAGWIDAFLRTRA